MDRFGGYPTCTLCTDTIRVIRLRQLEAVKRAPARSGLDNKGNRDIMAETGYTMKTFYLYFPLGAFLYSPTALVQARAAAVWKFAQTIAMYVLSSLLRRYRNDCNLVHSTCQDAGLAGARFEREMQKDFLPSGGCSGRGLA